MGAWLVNLVLSPFRTSRKIFTCINPSVSVAQTEVVCEVPPVTPYNPYLITFDTFDVWTKPHTRQIVLTWACPMLALQMSDVNGANSNDISRRYSVQVNVANQNSGLNITDTGYNKWQYQRPNITSVPQISMWGTFLTITGVNFGPVGTVVSLEVCAARNETDFLFQVTV